MFDMPESDKENGLVDWLKSDDVCDKCSQSYQTSAVVKDSISILSSNFAFLWMASKVFYAIKHPTTFWEPVTGICTIHCSYDFKM